jgi:gluconate 5-dehydrogenase
VNNRGPLESLEETLWREVIDVNLTGAFLVTQFIVRGMISRKAGKIINICSVTSEVERPTGGAYASAKGGLKMLTKAMAVEWIRYNIQVNGIGPGFFRTDLTKPLAENPEFNSWLIGRTPAARWGQPSELVGTAIYLASDASSFVSGQIIYVDGGLLASM